MPKMALNTIQETLKPISAMEAVAAFLSMRNSAKPSQETYWIEHASVILKIFLKIPKKWIKCQFLFKSHTQKKSGRDEWSKEFLPLRNLVKY